MAQLKRVQGQTELKCDADKFFDVWARKPHLISKLCPNKFPKIELHEGEWGKVGAFETWNYVYSDISECEFVKKRIEELDEENRFVRYSYHDGFIVRNYYKTFKSKIQATPKSNGGCIVTLSFEYEKMNENAPEPNMYIDFLLGSAKDIDACLCSA